MWIEAQTLRIAAVPAGPSAATSNLLRLTLRAQPRSHISKVAHIRQLKSVVPATNSRRNQHCNRGKQKAPTHVERRGYKATALLLIFPKPMVLELELAPDIET